MSEMELNSWIALKQHYKHYKYEKKNPPAEEQLAVGWGEKVLGMIIYRGLIWEN